LRKWLSSAEQGEAAFALTKALKSKDLRFINPYHFVKVIVTLSRIPADQLCNEKLWDYVVSKSLLFFSSLSKNHQELVFTALSESLQSRGISHLLKPLVDERHSAND
jgi:hypothetical protein